MAHYTLYPSQQTFHSRRFLLWPPLLMVAVFCFGLVLVQSHNQPRGQSVASSRPAAKADHTPSKLSNKLPTVSPSTPAASSTIQADNAATASPAPTVSTKTSAATSASSSTATTNPQLSTTSSSKPQAAVSPASQTTNNNGNKPDILKTTTNALAKTLNSLIK